MVATCSACVVTSTVTKHKIHPQQTPTTDSCNTIDRHANLAARPSKRQNMTIVERTRLHNEAMDARMPCPAKLFVTFGYAERAKKPAPGSLKGPSGTRDVVRICALKPARRQNAGAFRCLTSRPESCCTGCFGRPSAKRILKSWFAILVAAAPQLTTAQVKANTRSDRARSSVAKRMRLTRLTLRHARACHSVAHRMHQPRLILRCARACFSMAQRMRPSTLNSALCACLLFDSPTHAPKHA